MGGMTKLAMATTIAVSLILTFFLILLLILLIDFFFSILRRKSQNANNPESPDSKTPPQNQTQNEQMPKEALNPPVLPSFYAHGVLQAPTSFLLTVPKLDQFVCVSNPVYDGTEAGEVINNGDNNGVMSTPYETPETSPSHFGEEEEYSPPLKYMKKLPSISATETNRNSSCSASSSNVCYSPSW
ncbi:hypothetical protein LUZ60_002947 [Juncus effusus]|nr:hypothetical protein LUZ60_002947 [Juncus effusus]